MSKWEAFKTWCKERWAYLAAALGLLVWGFLLGRREKAPVIKAPTVDLTKVRAKEQQQVEELDQDYSEQRQELEEDRLVQIVDQVGGMRDQAPDLLNDSSELTEYLRQVGQDVRKK